LFVPLLPALAASWAWRAVEAICGSNDIVVFLSMCVVRQVFDRDIGIGAHQDAVSVSDDIP
jgi:hypothetical protein